MKMSELKKTLSAHSDKTLRFVLPTGTKIPVHAHVTELARLDKRFVDCGGTFRTESTCRLQTWFADDTTHRLDSTKLLKIFDAAARVLNDDDLDIEVEHEAPFISHFPVVSLEVEGEVIKIQLGTSHTACLASDKCSVAEPARQPIDFKPLPKLQKSNCCS